MKRAVGRDCLNSSELIYWNRNGLIDQTNSEAFKMKSSFNKSLKSGATKTSRSSKFADEDEDET